MPLKSIGVLLFLSLLWSGSALAARETSRAAQSWQTILKIVNPNNLEPGDNQSDPDASAPPRERRPGVGVTTESDSSSGVLQGPGVNKTVNPDSQTGVLPGPGQEYKLLFLGESVSLEGIGTKDDALNIEMLPCNLNISGDGKPQNFIPQFDIKASAGGIHQLRSSCMKIKEIKSPGETFQPPPVLLDAPIGSYYDVRLPYGFAMAGFEAESCSNGIRTLIPYGRKVNDWGVNDIMWRGPTIRAGMGSAPCQFKKIFCPKGMILTQINGQFRSGGLSAGGQLSYLEGTCHAVHNNFASKPIVESVNVSGHHVLDADLGDGDLGLCNLSCRNESHPNGVVVGLEAWRGVNESDESRPKWLVQVALLCKDATLNGLVPETAEYRGTARCGAHHDDENEKLARVTFSSGYAATGIHAWGYGFVNNLGKPRGVLHELRLFGEPLDVFSHAPHTVSSGPNLEYKVESAGMGYESGEELKLHCPHGKVVTDITFNEESGVHLAPVAGTGFYGKHVSGIEDITCAQVTRTLQGRITKIRPDNQVID